MQPPSPAAKASRRRRSPRSRPSPGAQSEPEHPPSAADCEPSAGDGRAVTPVEDLAAELRAAEEVAAEQVEAVLTAVLDRLGSAHHRPFSRS